jgi:hypothetical protein
MAESYHHLLIAGPRGWTLGFIHGHLRGSGTEAMPLDAEAEGFACEPLRERLREVLDPGREIIHLLARDDVLARVRRAIADRMAVERGVELKEDLLVAGARFDFSVQTYSRAHAERIRALFAQLPAGVQLTKDTSFREILDPEAAGAHSLAPAHGYELRGEGSAAGPLAGVLDLHRACRETELINERPIHFLYA